MNRKSNPWVALAALVLLATILLCICTGCSSAEAAGPEDARFTVEKHEYVDLIGARIITDTETGVQYLLVSYGQGVGVTVLQPAPESGEAEQ